MTTQQGRWMWDEWLGENSSRPLLPLNKARQVPFSWTRQCGTCWRGHMVQYCTICAVNRIGQLPTSMVDIAPSIDSWQQQLSMPRKWKQHVLTQLGKFGCAVGTSCPDIASRQQAHQPKTGTTQTGQSGTSRTTILSQQCDEAGDQKTSPLNPAGGHTPTMG